MARLIMVRHGESVANLERRFTLDASEPLTPLGIEQARQRGEAIRVRHAPVALYASPYVRAFQTAEQIGLVLGLTPIVIEDLREQSFGIYHGRPYTELYGAFAAGSADRWGLTPDGGENLRDVATRAGAALDEIARRHLGVEVVVVSHGGVMSALRGWVTNDYASVPTPTANAGGYLLHWDGERYAGPFDLESPASAALGHLG